MKAFTKFVAATVVGSVLVAPAASASTAGLPSLNVVVGQVTTWVVSALQLYTLHAVRTTGTTLATQAPSVTILDGNHMIIEAKRLTPDSTPFRGLSGPRKKQSRS